MAHKSPGNQCLKTLIQTMVLGLNGRNTIVVTTKGWTIASSLACPMLKYQILCLKITLDVCICMYHIDSECDNVPVN